ncbi:MAG: L7Ae/L30e/S12e/Gadd45 family ribosomal protein [Christensenellales bacterium]|jgi:ribosomal protein L7Ae-like RNA K-turn-binding protein
MAVSGLIGLAFRAGQLVPGAQMALTLIRDGKAALVLLDETASANTLKKVQNACNHHRVQVMLLGGGVLGRACGRPGMAAGAVKPCGLADRLLAINQEMIGRQAAAKKETIMEDKG